MTDEELDTLLDCGRVGRLWLILRIAQLVSLAKARGRELREAYDNLTATQRRCSELLTELRDYRASGINLPGWWCACGKFNGEAMRKYDACMLCERPKSSSPPVPLP